MKLFIIMWILTGVVSSSGSGGLLHIILGIHVGLMEHSWSLYCDLAKHDVSHCGVRWDRSGYFRD